MALIECKECSHKISEHAVKCPKCGAESQKTDVEVTPINIKEETKPLETKKVESKVKKKRSPLFIIGSAIIITLIVILFAINFNRKNSSTDYSTSNKQSETKLFQENSEELEKKEKEKRKQQRIKKEKENRKKQLVNDNLGHYLKASVNNYRQKLLGGIKNLKITVSNTSDYTIEQVTVVVKYHKLNNKIYTTKNLYFKNLKANSQITLNAPETNVGTYIRYQITEVIAPSLN
jgi:hypothetical protein